MRFFDRLSNGWQLAKTSLHIIEKEKTLLLFPVFSTLALFMVCATFFGGGYFIFGEQILTVDSASGETELSLLAYVLAFAYYFVTYFVVIFFNSALVHCAVQVLDGQPTNLSEGLEFATSKLDKIIMWTGIAATVGLILKALQSNEKLGQLVAALVGAAWSILTFFVVPVLLYEDKDVFGSIKQSGQIMRKKWGESLGANFGFGFINILAIIGIIILSILFGQIHVAIGIVFGIVSLLILGTVMSAAQTVFLAAIYQRVNDRPTGNFNNDVLDSAFIRK